MATPPIEKLDRRELKAKLDEYASAHDTVRLQPHETPFMVGICRENRDGVVSHELVLLDHQSRPERFGLADNIEEVLDVVRELFGCRTYTTRAIEATLNENGTVTLVIHGRSLRSFLATSLESIR